MAARASTEARRHTTREIGVSEMDSQRGGEQWRLSPELEAELRQTLLRVRTEGASNQEILKQLMRSPAVLEIVHEVTRKNSVKTRQGASTPGRWWLALRKDPELREEWRCETVYVLGRRLRAALEADPEAAHKQLGDPEQNVAGYWRMKVAYAAIKAADNLIRESGFKTRYDPERQREVSVECFDPSVRGGILDGEDKKAEADLMEMELRLDLAMLIDGLENRREREVMRLSEVEGYDYPEIAAKLGISYENVRGAVERAREAFQKRLGIDQAKLIDALEDPRQRAVMRLAAMKYNNEKIAAELGISKEQVQSDAKQARKVLQDRLRWVLLKRLRLVA